MSTLATMNGNVIMLPHPTMASVFQFVQQHSLTQFAVREVPDGFSLSTPVTKTLEEAIPGILHSAWCPSTCSA